MERQGSRSKRAPYARKESRKSFFSKMKDSFRDIMYPSWLAGNEKNEASGSATRPMAPVTATCPTTLPEGSSQEMPQFSNPGFALPNGQPRTVEYGGVDPGNVSFQSPNLPPPISEFTSSLLPLNRLTEKSDSVLANEDTMSQRSDASKSTSGCSSMVPQLDNRRREGAVEKRKVSDEESAASRSPPSPVPQPTAKRPRLNVTLSSANRTWTQRFNDTLHSQQPPGNLKRPAFNTSLFGSPFNEDSSVLGTSFHESSFYPGKTVFGGRSSLRSSQRKKIDLNQSLPSRLSIPVKSFKAKPKANPVKEAVTSSTAKRILDVLDRMPTPLSDAKKIPVIVPQTWTQNPSFFSKEVASTSIGPPTRRHTLGGLASISTNRQTSTGTRWNNTMVRPDTSSEFSASVLQREDTVKIGLDPPPGSSGSGKVRREKSYHRGSASVKPTLEEEDTVVISPALRTDFTLPVSSIPQFNFGTPSIQQHKSMSKVESTQKPVGLNFTFSSPIVEKVPGNKPRSPQNVGGFQFSSPISLDNNKKDPTSTSKTEGKTTSSFGSRFSTPVNMQTSFSTAPKPKPKTNGPPQEDSGGGGGGFKPASALKSGSVMDILGGGGPSHAETSGDSGRLKPASVLKSGSVMDVLGGGGQPHAELSGGNSGFKPAIELKSGSVMDILGGGLSAKTPPQTSSCTSTGTKSVPPTSQQNGIVDKGLNSAPLNALFKKSGWECDVCLINNKDDADKCLACQSPRPGGKKTTVAKLMKKLHIMLELKVQFRNLLSELNGQDQQSVEVNTIKDVSKSDLIANLKPASKQWECEVCLIQNKADVNSCVACQSPKPLNSFKHPAGDWECDTCLVNNKETSVKCVACNYARPGPPRTQAVPSCVKSFSMSQPSGFSFQTNSSSDTSKDSSHSSLTSGGFKLGLPTTSNKSDFKFGATSITESISKTSNSGFKLGGLDPSASLTTSGIKFGFTKTSDNENKKPQSVGGFTGFKFNVNSSDSNKKVDSDKSIDKVEAVQNSKLSKDKTKLPASNQGPVLGTSQSNDDKGSLQPGGFKLGFSASADNKTSESSTPGFQFGVSTSKTSSSVSGFQFGTLSSNSTSPVSSSSVTSTSVLTNSNVISSQISDTKASNPFTSNTASLGGFTVPTGGSLSSGKSLNNTSQIASIPAAGGFNFTSTLSKDNNTTPATTSSFTGFTFGGTNAHDATTNKEAQKPVFGGLASNPISTTAPVLGGFNFAQKKSDGSTSGTSLVNSSESTAPKRGRDEDSGETVAKKSNFSFGSGINASTPFQFGATNNTTQNSSSPFVFGQQSTATTQAGAFAFGIKKPDETAKPVFGSVAPSTQTTTSAPVFGNTNSVFGFTGQKTGASNNTPSQTANVFNSFGSNAPQSTAPAAGPTFNFGSGNTNSSKMGASQGNIIGGASAGNAFGGASTGNAFGGASTGNVFGGNAPSTTPSFGATPPVFGSQNTTAVTTAAAPAFGGTGVFQFGADKTLNTAQPPQATNSLFQFGAKPTEDAQPTNTGFNFNSSQAGLGAPNFNFSQSAAPGAFAFNASPAPTNTGERKIKRAVRKLKR